MVYVSPQAAIEPELTITVDNNSNNVANNRSKYLIKSILSYWALKIIPFSREWGCITSLSGINFKKRKPW